MESIELFFGELSGILWGFPMILALMGTHLFFTVILRFPQRNIFKAIRLSVSSDKGGKGEISPFGALATTLASTIGTGNIIGVATAVALGGPGAVFWCWITGVLGISTKYAEGVLAVKYREVDKDGNFSGGPMYALSKGVKSKLLAVLFCIFTAIAAFGIGNMVQANSLSILLKDNYGVSQYLTGAVILVLVAMVTIFGIRGIARVCSFFVPIMAVSYVVGCFIILFVNRAYLGESISLIVSSAFSSSAVGGGFVGSTVIMAARYGIARGLFSNESGLGSAPIIAAAAQTRNPVRQALISSTSTFWDTVVVCAITGMVIVSSIIAHPDIDHTNGALLTIVSFNKLPYIGNIVLTFGLMTFTFSTILGWSYYGEKAIEYLGGRRVIIYYRILWLLGCFVGSVINITLVWNISDCMNACMAIPNIISLIVLYKVVVGETKKYLWSGNLDKFDNQI